MRGMSLKLEVWTGNPAVVAENLTPCEKGACHTGREVIPGKGMFRCKSQRYEIQVGVGVEASRWDPGMEEGGDCGNREELPQEKQGERQDLSPSPPFKTRAASS